MYALKEAFKMPLMDEVKTYKEKRTPGVENSIIGGYVPYDTNTYERGGEKKQCSSMSMYNNHDLTSSK